MSIDEFMQFALDVMKKTKSSMEEFKTRFVEVKKQWIENHKGHSKLFDEEEEEGDDEEEEGFIAMEYGGTPKRFPSSWIWFLIWKNWSTSD